ncbi:unnamed protein product [Prorocentrum cordatum]|uniref:catechol O-methyltransferase n=1 Tax=Prorocentrum cordatum TaxID=2364126 RepID=A0ABN9U1G1_9DINO|nr:unnamed protein product [Polarella glacialis]
MRMFWQFQRSGSEPDEALLTAAVRAAQRGGLWEQSLGLYLGAPRALPTAAFGAAVLACSEAREWERALRLLDGLPQRLGGPELDQPAKSALRAYSTLLMECEQGGLTEHEMTLLRAQLAPRPALVMPARAPYAKELALLQHVLATATRGDPASVCAAMQRFGEDTLALSRRWLKIVAGEKAGVVASALRRAPAGEVEVLEIGAYCGFSAVLMARERPSARVTSLELDPVHVVIARNVIAWAGLTGAVRVVTGHSRHLLPRLARAREASGRPPFSFVFMDQRGSRYHEDLELLERHGLVRPGTVVLADNVLKPGAPLFLWRVTQGRAYSTTIVSVTEFAMPAEDWMSISTRTDHPDATCAEPPAELRLLDAECDRTRDRASNADGGVPFADWRAAARRLRSALLRAGISAQAQAPANYLVPEWLRGQSQCEGSAGGWAGALRLLSASLASSELDVGSWKAVISACAQSGQWAVVLDLLRSMQAHRAEPDSFALTTAMGACARGTAWAESLRLMGEMAAPDAPAFGAAIAACARGQQAGRALRLLERMRRRRLDPDAQAFGAAMDACESAGKHVAVLKLFDEMRSRRLAPLPGSFHMAIGACTQRKHRGRVPELLQLMGELSVGPGLHAYRVAIGASPARALELLAEARRQGLSPDVVTYNAAVAAAARRGRTQDALGLLRGMAALGAAPDREMRLRRVALDQAGQAAALGGKEESADAQAVLPLLRAMREERLAPAVAPAASMLIRTFSMPSWKPSADIWRVEWASHRNSESCQE